MLCNFEVNYPEMTQAMRATMLVVGARVARGPDWISGNEDGNGEGTVSAVHPETSFVRVRWDSNPQRDFGSYYYGHDNKYHVKLVNPKVVELRRDLAAANDRENALKHELEVCKTRENLQKRALSAAQTSLKKIGALLDDSAYSDVIVKCGDQVFNAHKAIITSQSDVFVRMLKEGMVEGNTNKIDVKEMEADILKMMMRFLYDGSVEPEIGAQVACELYAAAHMYEIAALEVIIQERIIEKLDSGSGIEPEDAGPILTTAELYCNEKIKSSVIAYVGKNKENVWKSTNWQRLEKEQPALGFEIMKKLLAD